MDYQSQHNGAYETLSVEQRPDVWAALPAVHDLFPWASSIRPPQGYTPSVVERHHATTVDELSTQLVRGVDWRGLVSNDPQRHAVARYQATTARRNVVICAYRELFATSLALRCARAAVSDRAALADAVSDFVKVRMLHDALAHQMLAGRRPSIAITTVGRVHGTVVAHDDHHAILETVGEALRLVALGDHYSPRREAIEIAARHGRAVTIDFGDRAPRIVRDRSVAYGALSLAG